MHKRVTDETTKIHVCKTIENNKGISVEYLKGQEQWILVDDDVKIEGQKDCCFAIGISYCPFCGEEL